MRMTQVLHDGKTPPQSSAFANDVAFGVEQTILCLSTDAVTDPLISNAIQKRFGGKDHQDHLQANMVAEVGGDVAGLAAFVALRQFCRPIFNKARDHMGWAIESLERRKHADRLEQHPEQGEAIHQKSLWKADNIIKTNTLSILSTAANAAIMKHHSHYSWGVLIASKYAASFVTTGIMLGIRWLMPRTMQQMDAEISTRYIDPTIKKIIGHTPKPDTISLPTTQQWRDRVRQAEESPSEQQSR